MDRTLLPRVAGEGALDPSACPRGTQEDSLAPCFSSRLSLCLPIMRQKGPELWQEGQAAIMIKSELCLAHGGKGNDREPPHRNIFVLIQS